MMLLPPSPWVHIIDSPISAFVKGCRYLGSVRHQNALDMDVNAWVLEQGGNAVLFFDGNIQALYCPRYPSPD